MARSTVAVSAPDNTTLELVDVDVSAPGPGEVLIEVASAGICHTDIASHHGLFGTKKPVVLGHEGAGTVREIGDAVSGIAVGDRVLMTMSGCGACVACLSGDSSYCGHIYELNMLGGRLDGSSAFSEGVLSHFGRQSSFSTMTVVPQQSVVVLAPDTDLHTVGPLGCGLMTGAGAVLQSLRVAAGRTVVVFGVGAVGLGAIMAARLSGASKIVAVDRFANRLTLAEALGATATVDAAGDDVVGQVRDLTSGGADYTIEASGNPAALTAAIDGLGYRGVCGIVGTAGMGVAGSFDWAMLQIKGATIRGICLGDANGKLFIPKLLDLHAQGRFPFEQLITRYPFAEINRAFADAESGAAVKPVLIMS